MFGEYRLLHNTLCPRSVEVKTLASKAIACFAVTILIPTLAIADVLYLKNGDRITGTIKRIWDEEVTIEPEYSDEFQVDLPLVARIESERDFEIEMPDGSDVVAKMQGIDDDGNQLLVIDGESIAVPLSELRDVDEPEDFYDWEVLVDYSLTINDGNTDSLNSRLAGEGMFKHGDHRHIGSVVQITEEQDSATTKDQSVLTYTYNWLFDDPWFFAANAQLERDPIRELERRITASAGIGRDIWNDPHRFLNIQVGAGLTDEEIGLEKETSTVAAWLLRFRHKFFSDDFEVLHNHSIVETIDGRDNTIIKTSTGIRYEITDLLYMKVSLDWDHESQPAGTAEKTDKTFVIGAGLEFD
jgi:putative salt-induced outer membrane protein YdiY